MSSDMSIRVLAGPLLCAALCGPAFWPTALSAQSPPASDPPVPPAGLTLTRALEYAERHYPAVRAAVEQVNASAATVRVARSAYLPQLNAVWQTNRATVNNVTGPLLPQSILAPISGPPIPAASATSVWGTAVGGLLSWDVFDMGVRSAAVDAATAALTRSRAEEAETRLGVQAAVGAASLTLASAEQGLVAARADVERRTVLARAAHVLADNQLRAGADASRADAELAAARTRALLASQTAEIARHTLSRALGTTSDVAIDTTHLLETVPAGDAPLAQAATHPSLVASRAAVEVARAHESVVATADRPHVLLQSSASARGSGAAIDGRLQGGTHGLSFDRANWIAGVQVVFPNLLDASGRRAQRAAAGAATRLEDIRAEDTALALTAQQRTADTMTTTARAIALNTPVQLAAARQGEAQARARYDAGLAGIADVADAQGLLAAAEYQHAAASVAVWQALLTRAVAAGDIAGFLDELRAAGVN